MDPLAVTRQIEDHYRRYLESAFSPRTDRFRRAFEEALAGGLSLTKGPYLQASPPYVHGESLKELIRRDLLCQELARIGTDEFPLERSLYLHQQQAIEKAVSHSRNLVVATGTGSGKTECFLLPIVDALLRESQQGTLADPGVRALLLYPMNALANDQLKRLRRLLAPLPEITFGRYVGETPHKQDEAEIGFRNRYPGEPRVSNEILSREVMQYAPPHILLTNYAMLEYLLLRPADSSLFDGETGKYWRFVVLDEAHVYDGTEGTEIAMLMRRVKDRVVSSERGRVQCFATSATLGNGEADYPKLIRFAEDLFDEPFEWDEADEIAQDVVGATKEPLAAGDGSHEIPADQIRGLASLARAEDWASLEARVRESCSELSLPAVDPVAALIELDTRVVQVQRLLEEGAQSLSSLAREVFPEDGSVQQLVDLVDLASRVRRPGDELAIIPARYHFFVRALEGAFVCIHPDHDARQPFLRLSRHERCPSCSAREITSRMFELGVCRRCGAEYLAGTLNEEVILETVTRGNRVTYLLIGQEAVDENEDEIAASDDAGSDVDERFLCPSCGDVSESRGSGCKCGSSSARVRVLIARPAKGSDVLRRCPSCSSRSNVEIVNRFLTSTDAPITTIGTALYQELSPDSSERAPELVGQGRRLLMFSDSRQAAAFLAPYLERTYNTSIHRRLITQVLEATEEPMRTEDLVVPLRKLAEDCLVLDPDDSALSHAAEVRSWLMREILSTDRRANLEGTGIAEIAVALPKSFRAPQPLLALGFSEAEISDLFYLLLGTLRISGAATFPGDVDVRDDMFAPLNREIGVREEGSEPGVIGWMPASGSNRRLDLLGKIFERKQLQQDPKEILRKIWDYLTNPQGEWVKTLVSHASSIKGQLWRIDYEKFEFSAASDSHIPLVCDTCRAVWWRSVEGVCSTYGCNGTVNPLEDPERVASGRFAHLYRTLRPLGMNVQEHTAQWTQNEASRIQDAFVRGEINVLSCSTTFELGVDVGEVEAVLLRNVPPSPANYIQRAGRAGRRMGSAAVAVTFAQRRAHDLSYFDDPLRMVDGVIAAPRIVLQNKPIVRRHMHSVAFAAFQRLRRPHKSVEDFFRGDAGSRAYEEFIEWLRTRPENIGSSLNRIVPDEIQSDLALENWGWVEALVEPSEEDPTQGWLYRAANEVNEELDAVDELIEDAKDSDKFNQAARLDRYRRTVSTRDLLGFLASRNVLPKYGFPVDVVPLNLSRTGDADASKLDLNRDLKVAISEYAPGAEIVAGKALWKSVGLTTRQERAWPTRYWGVCKECGAFRQNMNLLEDPCEVCGGQTFSRRGQFVIPIFGFVGERSKQKPGEARPTTTSFSETFFSEYQADDPSELTPVADLPDSVVIRYSRQGRITVVNRGIAGRPFRICERCGFGEPAPLSPSKTSAKQKSHRDIRRPGRTCNGQLQARHLGHEYLTDVLEIRLGVKMNEDEARSALYALLEGAARALSIKREEIDGTLHRYAIGAPSAFVLFDSVPGGAGHVQQIGRNLPDVISSGIARVSNCECGDETSCYSCLRNYWNQTWHEQLSRAAARAVLKSATLR